jgi:hypothetical protein
MGYDIRCDSCGRKVKKKSHAYFTGAILRCPQCFSKTPEGKRLSKAIRVNKRLTINQGISKEADELSDDWTDLAKKRGWSRPPVNHRSNDGIPIKKKCQ